MKLDAEALTLLAIVAKMGPFVLTDAFVVAPQFYAPCTVLAFVRLAERFAIFDDLGQMNRHVTVNVQDLPVHDQTSKTAYESLLNRRSSQMFSER